MADEQIKWNEEVQWNDVPANTISSTLKPIEVTTDTGIMSRMFTPQERRDFNWENVSKSGNIGAGVGGAIGLATGGPVGAIAGAAGGGLAGLTGGVAGELSATFGASPATQLTTELAGGGIPTILQKLGGASLIKILNYRLGRATDLTKDGAKFTKDEVEATLAAKEAVYGKAKFKGMYTSDSSDATQELLRKNFNVQGEGQVSDILRQDLYKSLTTLKDQPNAVPNVFRTSPEYKELIADLESLSKRAGKVGKGDIRNIEKVVSNELSKDPKVAPYALPDLFNLIQNGGSFEGKVIVNGKPEITKLITEPVRLKTVEYFDKFLQRTTGAPQYSALKAAEKLEFQASAMDSIPTILSGNMKNLETTWNSALDNISKTPEGKEMFKNAVNQHFLMLGKEAETAAGKTVGMQTTPKALTAELSRLRPALEYTGIMTKQEIEAINKTFASLPKNISIAKRNAIAWDIAKKSLIGGYSAEMAQ